MNLTFYNTLTHKKEEFKPIDEKLVKMYKSLLSVPPPVSHFSTQEVDKFDANVDIILKRTK